MCWEQLNCSIAILWHPNFLSAKQTEALVQKECFSFTLWQITHFVMVVGCPLI